MNKTTLQNVLFVFLKYTFGIFLLILTYFVVFFAKGERIYFHYWFDKWVYIPRNPFKIKMNKYRHHLVKKQ